MTTRRQPTATPADPILEEVRRFYDDHHEGIEQARAARRYFYDSLRAHPARARSPPDSACSTSAAAPAICWRRSSRPRRRDRRLASAHVAAARDAPRRPRPALHRRRRRRPAAAGAGGRPVRRHRARQRRHAPHGRAGRAGGAARRCATGARASSSTATAALWQPVAARSPRCCASSTASRPRPGCPRRRCANMLGLADFEVVRRDAQIDPARSASRSLSDLLNRYVATCPVFEWLSLMYGLVARPAPAPHRATAARGPRTSVIIPCRNEAGHIPALVDAAARPGPGQRVPLRRGQLHGRHRGGAPRTVVDENPRPALPLPQAAGPREGRRGAPGLRGSARRHRAHPRLRHGCRARRTSRSSWTRSSAARASSSTARAWSIRWKGGPCAS